MLRVVAERLFVYTHNCSLLMRSCGRTQAAGQLLLSRTKKVLQVKNLKNKMLQAGKVECLVKEAAVSFLQLQSSPWRSN